MQLPQDRGTYVLTAVAVCLLLLADPLTDVVEWPSSPPPHSSSSSATAAAAIGQLAWGLPFPQRCRTGEPLPRAPSVLVLSPWGAPVAGVRIRVEVVHVRHAPSSSSSPSPSSSRHAPSVSTEKYAPSSFDCSTENLRLLAGTAAWLSWAAVGCEPAVTIDGGAAARAGAAAAAAEVGSTLANGVAGLGALRLSGPPGLYTLQLSVGGGAVSVGGALTAVVEVVSEVATLEVMHGSEPPASGVFGKPLAEQDEAVATVVVRSDTGRALAGRRVVAVACPCPGVGAAAGVGSACGPRQQPGGAFAALLRGHSVVSDEHGVARLPRLSVVAATQPELCVVLWCEGVHVSWGGGARHSAEEQAGGGGGGGAAERAIVLQHDRRNGTRQLRVEVVGGVSLRELLLVRLSSTRAQPAARSSHPCIQQQWRCCTAVRPPTEWCAPTDACGRPHVAAEDG
jgi:hypothetical protein